MAHLLVVAHCPSPNTLALADALVEGASDPALSDVVVRRLGPLDAGPEDVLACDGILLATTENFGYMAGALKDFLERIYYPCLEETRGLPWGLLVKAGQDGSGARSSVERIVTGLKWRSVVAPLVLVGRYREAWLEDCREMGMTMAAGLEAGVF